jgi:UDP-2,3-diacylglucosamine pyrophosphatase LpxH
MTTIRLLRSDVHKLWQCSVWSCKLNLIHNDLAVTAASQMDALIVPGARPLYRSIFVSDTHLGTRGARCDFLADFLRRTSCQHLFLVGDIIDGWRLRKSWYWDEHHDEVLRQILRQARAGTEVTYIPGNHDEMFRAWLDPIALGGLEIAGIRLRQETVHVTAAGKRLLVMHGDEFDSVVRYARFLAVLGESAYTTALLLNRWFNAVRRRLGYPTGRCPRG